LDGNGGFGPQQVISIVANRARSVRTADLDGDGDIDVLSASSEDDKIAWYQNRLNVDGTFGPQQVISNLADGAWSLHVADLDGDGDSDVLSASINDDKIAWYENLDGLGNFGPQQIVTTQADGSRSVFAEDLDGDGDLDVLSASANDDMLAWYQNWLNVDGTFGSQQVITTMADGAQTVYAADMDSDGDLDVLSASQNDDKIAWYPNLGQGNFGTQQVITYAVDIPVAKGAWSGSVSSGGLVSFIVADDCGTIDSLQFANICCGGSCITYYTISWLSLASTFSYSGGFCPSINVYGSFDQTGLTSAGSLRVAWGFTCPIICTLNLTWAASPTDPSQGVCNVPSPIADGAEGVIAADLDKDGNLDVLSASYADDKVAWYKNLSQNLSNALPNRGGWRAILNDDFQIQ
jgi:uncharacterized protein YuzB (UPF0349 family)